MIRGLLSLRQKQAADLRGMARLEPCELSGGLGTGVRWTSFAQAPCSNIYSQGQTKSSQEAMDWTR